MTREGLASRMRALASSGHERAEDLTRLADLLDRAVSGYYADPQTVDVKSFLGCWARARRLWCDLTGEPLV